MKILLKAVAGDRDYFTSIYQALSAKNQVAVDCPVSWGLKTEGLVPDVVHIVCELRYPFPLLRKIQCPLVVTIHEVQPYFSEALARKYVFNPLVRANNRMLIELVNKVIVHGNYHRSLLINEGILKDKIEIVPHPRMTMNETNMQEDGQTVLFIGRIWDYKGIDMLLQSADVVQNTYPDVKFVVAGEGNFRPYIVLSSKVHKFQLINRFLDRQEVADLIQSSSIVVLPYNHGSQTGWVSAAYNFKKPVIATRVGNFADYVINEGTGLLVQPSYVSLFFAMCELLQNKEKRIQYGNKGHELLTSWSPEKIAEATVDVYGKAIRSRERVA